MASDSKEIQYALERRGWVEVSDGAIITTPIQLAHVQFDNVFVKFKGDVTYSGGNGKQAFNWKWESSYAHNPAALFFEGGTYDGDNGNQVSFLQINPDSTKSPSRISIKRADFYLNRGYVVDGNNVPKTDSMYFEDITSYGGGCLRWICSSTKGFDWCVVDNWRRVGGGRIGASFMVKNAARFQAEQIIDEGSPNLVTELRSNYVGPIGLDLVNCTGWNFIDDWWMEPWGSWDSVAPGCWGFSVRADETSGNYREYFYDLSNVTMNATGLSAGVKLFHGYGGDTSPNACSVRMNFLDSWKLEDGSTNFGGKIFPHSVRANNNIPYVADDRADFDDINSGSFVEWWQVDSNAHPYKMYADRLGYPASGYDATFTAEPAQYDD